MLLSRYTAILSSVADCNAFLPRDIAILLQRTYSKVHCSSCSSDSGQHHKQLELLASPLEEVAGQVVPGLTIGIRTH